MLVFAPPLVEARWRSRGKMSYQEAPPEIDQDFRRLVAALTLAPNDRVLRSSAVALAQVIRSRCIDLATWKADLSPEYRQREAQAAELIRLAGEPVDASR